MLYYLKRLSRPALFTFYFLLFTLTVIFTSRLSPLTPLAAEDIPYARVLKDNVCFYKSADERSALFYVPPTYYVKIIGESGDYFNVEYQYSNQYYTALFGYVKKSEVNIAKTMPSYPVYAGAVLRIVANSAEITEKAEDGSPAIASALKEQEVSYYGRVYNGVNKTYYYYVKFYNIFGYVKSQSCSAADIANHPDPLINLETQPSGGSTSGGNGGVNDDNFGSIDAKLQIFLIAAITVPTLFIVYFLFRPAKRRGGTPYLAKQRYNGRCGDEDEE